MHYTGTIWRPPYEAYSALIQVTAGCTHHKCKFCTLYEDVPFKFRMSPLAEAEEDLKEISRYYRNAKRVFFTGANPFVLSFDKLKTLAELVKKYYPKVGSIGCFARITDITPKTTEQLRELRELGYNSLTIGVEAGDDESLSFMHKGFGTKEIIRECKRLDEVGMDYNFFYLAGIYGTGRSESGAKNTAMVLAEVKAARKIPQRSLTSFALELSCPPCSRSILPLNCIRKFKQGIGRRKQNLKNCWN